MDAWFNGGMAVVSVVSSPSPIEPGCVRKHRRYGLCLNIHLGLAALSIYPFCFLPLIFFSLRMLCKAVTLPLGTRDSIFGSVRLVTT